MVKSNLLLTPFPCSLQVGRRELLCSILEAHSTVAAKFTLERLDLEAVASRTEGFVARDLQALINRALHHHLANMPMGKEVLLPFFSLLFF